MRQFLEIEDGLYLMPWAVSAVKASSLKEESCTVFMKGQSSQDGFVVKRDAKSVVEEIEDAIAADEDEEA